MDRCVEELAAKDGFGSCSVHHIHPAFDDLRDEATKPSGRLSEITTAEELSIGYRTLTLREH